MNPSESITNGVPIAGSKKHFRSVNGILLLDKPAGITSNRALQQVKRIFAASKAGHTGSLDPLATGMLPVCFGQATKASHWLLDAHKVYEVQASIGVRTSTGDADGDSVETSHIVRVTRDMLEAAIEQHRGPIEQVPPMYSALKQDGKRLYQLAREGLEVVRPARPVTIYELEILQFDPSRPVLRVRCSKGTYIRTLVETLATAMGTLAHIVALRRLALGPFEINGMVAMAELEGLAGNYPALDSLLLPVDAGLGSIASVKLSADEAYYFCHGHAVSHAPSKLNGLARIYDDKAVFLGIGEVLPDGRIAPRRLFA
jgi:tRNA pseudouridine55 synthase